MNDAAMLRRARSDDTIALKNIWKAVFGDTDELIDAFFSHYGAETAMVARNRGEIAAAGYLLPMGDIKLPGGGRYPCAMIYSVAVLPAHRSGGLGGRLTRELISAGHAGGFPAVALCPASDGLFDYYGERTGLTDWFNVSERTYTAARPADGRLIRLTAAEYVRLRGELLSGLAHIEQDERALSLQSRICELVGGGLYAISVPGGADGCAVVEAGETVAVKELLMPSGGGERAAIDVIACAFPSEEYTVRSPARAAAGEGVHRFGMLEAEPPNAELAARPDVAWYGLAFD